jgi:hypothetical protein
MCAAAVDYPRGEVRDQSDLGAMDLKRRTLVALSAVSDELGYPETCRV